jgi:site-specific DNA recombinase
LRCARDGNSYKDIIDTLNKEGITTRKGRKFSPSTLNSMLSNVKYHGTYLYNREDGKKKSKRVLIEKFDEVRTEGAIPEIVTKETFDKVQEILGNRKQCRPNLNAHAEYILTGKIYCAKCGSTMSGTANCGGRNKTRIRTYACPNHSSRRKSCDTKAINAVYLESAVKSAITEAVNAYIRDEDNLENIAKQSKASFKEEVNATNNRIASLEDNITRLITKAASSSVSPAISAQYEKEAEKAIQAKEYHNAKLANLKAKLAAIDGLIDEAKEHPIITQDELFATDVLARELVTLYIERIEIDDKNDKITVKLKEM